jgi:uncharacterized protein (TIGR00730 family)
MCAHARPTLQFESCPVLGVSKDAEIEKMNDERFSLCVYCGSRNGRDDAFRDAAHQVGTEIGKRGWQLVYGGGQVGLMGVVADATLAAGGTVVGVIPRVLMEREVGHQRLQELHVVETMHERKHLMAQRAHAFVALPGGIGTLEELYEVWTWRQLGYHDKPVALLNVNGYYDPLLAFMHHTVDAGFLAPAQMELLLTHDRVPALLDRIHALANESRQKADLSRI